MAFGFQASSPAYNITGMLLFRRIISLSDFQTGIVEAAHTTLETEQSISHAIAPLIDTIASLQGSDGEFISVSKVHELYTTVHDIVDNALSKQVGKLSNKLPLACSSLEPL